jgi:hypothetical protein
VVSPQEKQEAWAKVKGKRKRPRWSKSQICRCDTCSSSAYNDNMARHGPEQQIGVDYTLTDLVRLLGAESAEIQTAVERLRSLSVAAMDIESLTRPLDQGGPLPGCGVGYADFEAGGGFLESHASKVQVPIMICHLDQLASESEGPSVFTASDDSEEAGFALLSEYWEHVLFQHRRAVQAKRRVARPLLELTEAYKKAFINHSVGWTLGDRRARRAWLQEEIGRIARGFEQLSLRLLRQEEEDGGGLIHRALEASSAGERKKLAKDLKDLGAPASEVDEFVLLVETAHSSRSWTGGASSEDPWAAPDHRGLQSAWESSLPGKLEKAVRALIASYTIFSFYG